MANPKTGNQKLSKEEKKIKDVIPVLYNYQEEDDWKQTFDRLRQRYKGKHYAAQADQDRFTYNATFSNVNNMIPNLVLNNPRIRAVPINPKYMRKSLFGDIEQVDNIKATATMEAAVNCEYKRIKALIEHRKAIQDVLFAGFGVTKTGYSFNTISDEHEEYVKEDNVFLQRIPPIDFGFHPIATSPDDSPLLSHRIVQLKKQLEANKLYKNVDIVTPSLPKHLRDKLQNRKMDSSDLNFVTVWEVHDQENDEILTFAGENQILIRKEKREYKYKSSDFQVLTFSKDNDEMGGIAYLAMVEDEQEAMNEIMTFIVEHLHMFPGQLVYEEGAMDADDENRMRQGGQGAMIKVKELNRVLKQPPMPMGGEYFNAFALLQANQDRVLGIPDFIRASSNTRKSASESAFIQGTVDVKRQYLGGLVKAFILDGVDNLVALMQQYYDKTRYVLAEGTIEPKVIEYTKEDIQGEFQFDFDIEEMRSANQSEVQQMINALNIVASHPILVPILETMDPLKIGTQLFKKMGMNIEQFQLKDIEDATFVSPDRENLIVLDPDNPAVKKFSGDIPDAKPGENHMVHLRSHEPALQQAEQTGNARAAVELRRHMRRHLMLQQKQDERKNPSQPLAENREQGGPQPGNPAQGPVNMPAQMGAERMGGM